MAQRLILCDILIGVDDYLIYLRRESLKYPLHHGFAVKPLQALVDMAHAPPLAAGGWVQTARMPHLHDRAAAQESVFARMSRLGRSLVSGIPLLDADEVASLIDAVTADDVQALIAELYAPETLCVAGIGPDRDVFDRALDAFRAPVGGAA